jgi:hypothetical protein
LLVEDVVAKMPGVLAASTRNMKPEEEALPIATFPAV